MKKAILVVSFGTSYIDSLKKSIEKMENRIYEHFEEYDVYRAFTAHMIIRKLKSKYDMHVLTPEEALDELIEKGYEEVIMQPLHIIPGEEYQYIRKVQDRYSKNFKTLKLGRPIFYYQGIEELPQDYTLFIKSVEHLFKDNNGVVLFGHGTSHPSNAVYGCLQTVLEDEGYDNVFVGTVEGYPTFETVLKRIKKKNIKEVTLIPLMLVAGDHAVNDMASDDEDSWKSMFELEGIKANPYLHGLGEIDSFEDLYIKRIEDTIANRYEGAGETKKGFRK